MPITIAAGPRSRRYTNIIPLPPVTGLQWPIHTPGYLSALPGVGGYGMNSRGGFSETGDIAVIFVDTNSNTNSGSRAPSLDRVDGTRNIIAYTGDREYALRHTGTAGGGQLTANKLIIDCRSGWFYAAKSIPCPQGTPSDELGGVSWGGHFAPAPGVFFRGCKPFWNGSSNCHAWHLASYIGDDPGGLGGGSRDCFGGGAPGQSPTNNLMINCELSRSSDEIHDNFNPNSQCSFVYNAYFAPLHSSPIAHPDDPPGTDHGFGPYWGGVDTQPSAITSFRNLWAHTTDRNPLTNSRGLCHANNLHYNHGRPGGGRGEGVNLHKNGSTGDVTQDMFLNLLCNLFVRGPENNSSLVAARAQTGIPTGSRGYSYGNSAHGWTVTSQNQFITSSPANFIQAVLTSAIPSSWGGIAGVLEWAEDPLNPTIAEYLAFTNLMKSSTGMQPGRRLANSRLTACYGEIFDRYVGGSLTSQFIDTVADDDVGGDQGIFTVPEVSVDPNNPGIHWHTAWPTGSNLLTPVGSGTFANGLPCAGYTPLQIFWLNQHYYVGGK